MVDSSFKVLTSCMQITDRNIKSSLERKNYSQDSGFSRNFVFSIPIFRIFFQHPGFPVDVNGVLHVMIKLSYLCFCTFQLK